MLIARYLDRRTFQVAALVVVAVLMGLALSWWRAQPAADELVETRVLEMLDQVLIKTRFAQFPFLPSYWLATSVIQWGEGVVNLACFFLLVLLSHVCFFGFLAFTRLGNSFYESASAVQSRGGVWGQWFFRRKKSAFAGEERGVLEALFARLPWPGSAARALVVKDARTFWRDTSQWGQSVMLFGLLGAYVINLRHFTYQMTNPFWVNLVSFLNLGACSLNLATVTTRFVFPQFSLEGKRLWIVGMAPMGLRRVVQIKYWLACGTSLVVTVSLMLLSCWLLKMSWNRIGFFVGVVTVMTFSLNGLAVGLGVMYPNFKEATPSKIVSGFGGTLCLVLSFIYIVVSVLLLGFGTAGRHPDPGWVLGSIASFAVISFAIGWLPLKLGFAQLKKLEI
jgi:ABC-2 type transport system permease protein